MLRERVFGTLKEFLAVWDFVEFQDRPIKMLSVSLVVLLLSRC